MSDLDARARTLANLHTAREIRVLANVWDGASARVVAAYCAFHRDDEPELTRLLANEPKGEHGAWARWLCLRVYADRLQIQPQQAANLLRQALHTGRQKSSTADILGALQILQQRGESNR